MRNNYNKVYKVELQRRIGNKDNLIGGLIWESTWEDITDYFAERLTTVGTSLDDETLQGKLEQPSVSLRFDNISGKFNPEEVEGSFWEATGYMYHSRIRFWEYFSEEDGEAPAGTLPLIDGLIAREPLYREGMLADIVVNSKLDILRDHYILEDITSRVKRVSGQSIIYFIEDIFKRYYSELGVSSLGGVLRKEIVYDDVTPYSSNLLDMMNTISTDGGGIGGLTRDNKLFFTYFGAGVIVRQNFQLDADTEGLWVMDDTDYSSGTGTIVYDQSTNGNDLTVDITNVVDPWADGLFGHSVNNWWRVETDIFSGLTDYTLELLVSAKINRLPVKDITYSSTTYKFHPIFVWTYDDNANLGFANEVGNGYNFEGFMIDELGNLNFVTGTTAFAIGYGFYVAQIKSELMGATLGEEFIQYIAITVDDTNKYISFYVNGKLIKTTYIAELGYVSNNTARKKIAGCGFNQIQKGNGASIDFTINMEELGKTYYHGMKISNVVKTQPEIFTQYTELFGSGFALGG